MAESESRRPIVDHLLGHLTEREAKVVRLHYGLAGEGVEDASHDEIGAILGLPAETVVEILNRALQKLQKAQVQYMMTGSEPPAHQRLLEDIERARDLVHMFGVPHSGVQRSLFADIETLHLTIDPGDATPQEIADFYSALSDLYRAYGGKGLVFRSTTDVALIAGAL